MGCDCKSCSRDIEYVRILDKYKILEDDRKFMNDYQLEFLITEMGLDVSEAKRSGVWPDKNRTMCGPSESSAKTWKVIVEKYKKNLGEIQFVLQDEEEGFPLKVIYFDEQGRRCHKFVAIFYDRDFGEACRLAFERLELERLFIASQTIKSEG